MSSETGRPSSQAEREAQLRLAAGLRQPNARLRREILQALAASDEPCDGVMVDVAQHLEGDDAGLAATVLTRMRRPSPPVRDALLHAIAERPLPEHFRALAAAAGPNDEAAIRGIQASVERMARDPSLLPKCCSLRESFRAAAFSLVAMGDRDAALSVLTEALSSPDALARAEAILTLSLLSDGSWSDLTSLVEAACSAPGGSADAEWVLALRLGWAMQLFAGKGTVDWRSALTSCSRGRTFRRRVEEAVGQAPQQVLSDAAALAPDGWAFEPSR